MLDGLYLHKNPFKEYIDLPFAKGRLAVCHALKSYVTLIRKNLSSSMIYHILSLDYPELAKNIDIASPNLIHRYTGLALVKSLRNMDISYKKIAILRDPVKRVLSAFYSKFIFDAEWSSEIIDPVAHFLDKSVSEITFRDFIFYLQCQPDEWLDPHFTSQSRYILFNNYDVYLNMDIASSLEYYLRALGFELPKINDVRARYFPEVRRTYTDVDCSRMTVKEIWSLVDNKNPMPTLAEMVSADLVEIIKQRFVSDFELIDQCLNNNSL